MLASSLPSCSFVLIRMLWALEFYFSFLLLSQNCYKYRSPDFYKLKSRHSLAGFSTQCLTRLKSSCLQVMFSSGVWASSKLIQAVDKIQFFAGVKSKSPFSYCQTRTDFSSHRVFSVPFCMAHSNFQVREENLPPLEFSSCFKFLTASSTTR